MHCRSLILVLLAVACHRGGAKDGVEPAVKDTVSVVRDTTQVRVFRDTLGNESSSGARAFDLRKPGQRDSLRAAIRKERALWGSRGPRDYQFLLRVSCFCPGQKGWLLMEVRDRRLVRALDSNGRPVALTDWNTFSMDGLFDHLESWVGRNGSVEVVFDLRWHFPARVRTTTFPGPDAWSNMETRAFQVR